MVNISKQDLETFLKIYTPARMHIMFDTTYYCDMMCPHCHYACTTQSRNIIPESDVYAILSELHRNKPMVLEINFSGGEITTTEEINPGYMKRILSKSLEYGFYTTLMTNGSFVQKPYAEKNIKRCV